MSLGLSSDFNATLTPNPAYFEYVPGGGFRTALNDNILEPSGSGWTDLWAIPGASGRRFSSLSVALLGNTAITVGLVIFEGTNDPLDTAPVTLYSRAETTTVLTLGQFSITSNVRFTVQALCQGFRYVRCRIFTAFTGATTGVQCLHALFGNDVSEVGFTHVINSVNTIPAGGVAHSNTDSGNPIKVGGRVRTTQDTTLVNGDRADLLFSTNNALLTGTYTPESFFAVNGSGSGAITVNPAPGVGLRHYITHISLFNNGPSNQVANITNSVPATIWQCVMNTNGVANTLPIIVDFNHPLRTPTLNSALILNLSSNTHYNVHGFTAP